MPEIITCPDCGRKLRVPDTLIGKSVKCPDCNVKFTGGITSSPNGGPASKAPVKSAAVKRKPDDEDDRPAKRKPRDDEDDRPSKRSARDDDDRPSKRKARDEDEDHPRRRRSEYDDDDDRDRDDYRRGPSKADKRAGWKMTLPTGLNLLCYAIYVWLGTLAVYLLGCAVLALIGAAGASSGNANTFGGSMAGVGIGLMLLYGLCGLGYLAYIVLQGTGHGFCMAIPPKPGSPRKAMAIATFGCFAGMIVLYLLSCGVSFGFGGRGGNVVMVLPMAIFLGYFICYGIFMRGVALDMREPGLAAQVLYFMIAVPCLVVLAFVMGIVMFVIMGVAIFGAASSSTGQGAAGSLGAAAIFMIGCGILFLCVEIGLFIWYVVIVHQVRNAVRNYVG